RRIQRVASRISRRSRLGRPVRAGGGKRSWTSSHCWSVSRCRTIVTLPPRLYVYTHNSGGQVNRWVAGAVFRHSLASERAERPRAEEREDRLRDQERKRVEGLAARRSAVPNGILVSWIGIIIIFTFIYNLTK